MKGHKQTIVHVGETPENEATHGISSCTDSFLAMCIVNTSDTL